MIPGRPLQVYATCPLLDCRARACTLDCKLFQREKLIRNIVASQTSCSSIKAGGVRQELHRCAVCVLAADHILLAICEQVTDDLNKKGFFLGSPIIKELVFARSQQGRWRDLVELLRGGARRKESGRLSREALWSYGHAVLLGGIELSTGDIRQACRPGPGDQPPNQAGETGSLSGEQRRAVTEIQTAFRGSKTLVWDSASKMCNLPELLQSYVQPNTMHNESWDALICSGDDCVNAIRFTRHPSLGMKAGGIQKLLRRIQRASRMKLRVVHAVPAELFDSFAWRPWIAGSPVPEIEKADVNEDSLGKSSTFAGGQGCFRAQEYRAMGRKAQVA